MYGCIVSLKLAEFDLDLWPWELLSYFLNLGLLPKIDVSGQGLYSPGNAFYFFAAGDSGIGEESTYFTDENTDGRFYTEDESIQVLLEYSHKYVVFPVAASGRFIWGAIATLFLRPPFPQKLKQFADIVYRFWLHKRSQMWKFCTIHLLVLEQYVSRWG